MIKSLCIGTKCKEMEALLDGERDHYPYRSLAIAVLTITVKAAAIKTFQMDGISTTISFGYQV